MACLKSLRLLAASVWVLSVCAAPGAEPAVVQANFHADREALAALDGGLWRPMMAAYAANELAAYLDSFAGDAVFASGDIPTLNPMAQWRRATERRFLVRRNEAGRHRREYRFTERAVYLDWSSERGVVAVTDPNETRHYEFHYFARRIDGKWRITTAYTKRLPTEAGPAAFAAAAPAGDHARF